MVRMTGSWPYSQYRLPHGNVRCCGKAEVGREPGNGKLPPETFRLVGTNITKHLTAGIRSKAEVQKIGLNFRDVLIVAVPGLDSGRGFPKQTFTLSCADKPYLWLREPFIKSVNVSVW